MDIQRIWSQVQGWNLFSTRTIERVLAVLFVAIIVVACADQSPARVDSKKTEMLMTTLNITQPWQIPDWSAYREAQLQIENSLINTVSTYSFSVDMFGHPIFACKSSAFPIPFGMQLTAPEGLFWIRGTNGGWQTLPQMDPYGLFPPSDVRATWMNCTLKNGKVAPFYSELDVISSPFPIKWVDEGDGRGHYEYVDESQITIPLPENSSVEIDLTRPSQEELERRKREGQAALETAANNNPPNQ